MTCMLQDKSKKCVVYIMKYLKINFLLIFSFLRMEKKQMIIFKYCIIDWVCGENPTNYMSNN